MSIVQGINLQTDRYIRLQLLLTREVEDAEKEHREMLRLCKRGDAERATTYLRKHILSAGRNLLVELRKSRAASAA